MILLLAFHLICMNVASAGPLVCVWLDGIAAQNSAEAERVGKWLAWKSVQLAIVGAAAGLMMGWLKWDSNYVAVLGQFKSRLWWGVAEFLFSLTLMVGYGMWWGAKPRANRAARWVRSGIALLAATNLLYHFPTLFTLIASAQAGRLENVTVDSAMFRKLIASGEVPAVTSHFAMASFALTGTALIHFAWTASRTADVQTRAGIWGARIALGSTLLQIPIGLWLVTAIPGNAQQRLMGGDWIGSGLLVGSLLAMLSLLHQLSAVAFGDTSRRQLLRANLTMLAVVTMMSGVLQRLYL
jgi:hypothetical protein